MLKLILSALPAVWGLAKNAATRENVTESPTSLISVLGTVGGGIGLLRYETTGEAIFSALVVGASVIAFFLDERSL